MCCAEWCAEFYAECCGLLSIVVWNISLQRVAFIEDHLSIHLHLNFILTPSRICSFQVDVDAITDPFMRDATIAQINNFGQTPTKLFDKPHPKKMVLLNNSTLFIEAILCFSTTS